MPIGLYIHVPFCLSKCPYCDFYSLPLAGDDGLLDRYTASVEQALDRWADRLRTPADTLYFGGGTPSLLGGKRLARLIGRAERCFSLDDAEITLEANPADADEEGGLSETLKAFADAGGTRLSLGMQSASEACAASSPVPMNSFKYPVPLVAMTALMTPSFTVSWQDVIRNMLELESTFIG